MLHYTPKVTTVQKLTAAIKYQSESLLSWTFLQVCLLARKSWYIWVWEISLRAGKICIQLLFRNSEKFLVVSFENKFWKHNYFPLKYVNLGVKNRTSQDFTELKHSKMLLSTWTTCNRQHIFALSDLCIQPSQNIQRPAQSDSRHHTASHLFDAQQTVIGLLYVSVHRWKRVHVDCPSSASTCQPLNWNVLQQKHRHVLHLASSQESCQSHHYQDIAV